MADAAAREIALADLERALMDSHPSDDVRRAFCYAHQAVTANDKGISAHLADYGDAALLRFPHKNGEVAVEIKRDIAIAILGALAFVLGYAVMPRKSDG